MLALLLLTAVVLLVAFTIHKQKLRIGDEGLPFLGPFFDALVPNVAPLTPPSSPASLDLISTPPSNPTKQSPPVGSDSLASTQVHVSPSFYQYDHLQSTESPADFAPPPAVVEPVSVRLMDQVQTVVEPVSVQLMDQVQTVVEPVSVRLVDQVHVGDQTAPSPVPIPSEDALQPDGYEPAKVNDFTTKIVYTEQVPEPTPIGQEKTGSSRHHRHHRRSKTADGSKQSGSSRRRRRHSSQGDVEANVEAIQPTEPEVTADSAPAAEPITDFTIKLAEDKSSALPEAASAGQDNKGSSRRRHHRRSSTADGNKRSGSSRRRRRHHSQGAETAVAEGNKQPEGAADGAPAAEPIPDFKIKLAEDKPETTGASPAAEKRHHRHRSGSTSGRRGSKRSSSRHHRAKDGTAGEAVAVVKDSSDLAQEAGNEDVAGASDQQQRRHRRRSASDRSRRRRHSTSNADAAVQDSSGAQLSKDAIPDPLQQDMQ